MVDKEKLSDLRKSLSQGRWVVSRKKALVNILAGATDQETVQVLESLGISEDEFKGWKEGLTKFGINGLKVTRLSRRRKLRRMAVTQQ